MKRLLTILSLQIFLVTQGCALSVATPEIKGNKFSKTGATDNPHVRCILRKGENQGTVEGQIIVSKDFLDLGINLAASNKDGRLICSWCIQPDSIEKGQVVYRFILQEDLIEGANLSLFTKNEGMVDLYLNTVRVLPIK